MKKKKSKVVPFKKGEYEKLLAKESAFSKSLRMQPLMDALDEARRISNN